MLLRDAGDGREPHACGTARDFEKLVDSLDIGDRGQVRGERMGQVNLGGAGRTPTGPRTVGKSAVQGNRKTMSTAHRSAQPPPSRAPRRPVQPRKEGLCHHLNTAIEVADRRIFDIARDEKQFPIGSLHARSVGDWRPFMPLGRPTFRNQEINPRIGARKPLGRGRMVS